jgi:preprotein translocase SecE subunit
MAITQNKKNNLVESVIETDQNSKKMSDIKTSGSTNPPEKSTPKNFREIKKEVDKPKKTYFSFLRTTIEELKKVSWPSFNYVVKWAFVVILFTAIFSVSLGFFDHVFNNSLKFVNCTSYKGRNQPLNDCTKETWQQLTFR